MSVCSGIQSLAAFEFNNQQVPQLASVGYADDAGIVKRTFHIHIPYAREAYNPSILKHNDGFLLAFRHDYHKPGYRSAIGLVRLNRNFWPTSSTSYLDTGNPRSEDPRLFKANGTYNVIYTHVTKMNRRDVGCMRVTRFNPDTLQAIKSCDLSFKLNSMEKNWIPFIVAPEGNGPEEVHLVYKFNPLQILKLNLSLNSQVDSSYGFRPGRLVRQWQERWGEIRGGTPAIRIGDEYLSFFHSSFVANGLRYYVMGAITLTGSPPFHVKRISPMPIIFRDMYGADTSNPYVVSRIRVMFPSGLVEGQEHGRQVFYIVGGENDVALRGVVIDREKLLLSLVAEKY